MTAETITTKPAIPAEAIAATTAEAIKAIPLKPLEPLARKVTARSVLGLVIQITGTSSLARPQTIFASTLTEAAR